MVFAHTVELYIQANLDLLEAYVQAMDQIREQIYGQILDNLDETS